MTVGCQLIEECERHTDSVPYVTGNMLQHPLLCLYGLCKLNLIRGKFYQVPFGLHTTRTLARLLGDQSLDKI